MGFLEKDLSNGKISAVENIYASNFYDDRNYTAEWGTVQNSLQIVSTSEATVNLPAEGGKEAMTWQVNNFVITPAVTGIYQ